MKLSDHIIDHFRLTVVQQNALKRLCLITIKNLLYHLPNRYEHVADTRTISTLVVGEEVIIYGRVGGLKARKSFRTRRNIAEGYIEDGTGRIKCLWFNQPYIAKMFPDGASVKAVGTVSGKDKQYLSNPELTILETLPELKESLLGDAADTSKADDAFFPVYSESKGITSQWMRHALKKILTDETLSKVIDPIPESILKRYSLPSLKTALIWIHTPKKEGDTIAARKRFAFEEVFYIQLVKQKERALLEKEDSDMVEIDKKTIDTFTKRFNFSLTSAQTKAIGDIVHDFTRGHPMSRLLEGDVGSGKTAVAATTAYAVSATHPKGQDFGALQVAYMVPTEILAGQHFDSFIEYFRNLPTPIGLITGSGCKKFPSKVDPSGATVISRAQLLKWVANGEIAILIGTHALIQKTVRFKNLAYVIIDEQHRFGTAQRKALARGKSRTSRGTYAEKTRSDVENIDPLLYRDITYRMRNVLFNVKKELGGGHKEVVYQRAVVEELDKAKLSYKKEVRIPIMYNKKQIGIYQPDFVVDDKIILELKALSYIGTTEKKQLCTYLRGSEYRLALLANFGPKDLTIERVAYDLSRQYSASVPRSSASVPHLLSMTATPIPRTLALTIYGDLDLTLLDEMPEGRKPVITEVVTASNRERVYQSIKEKLKEGRQLYVICPRIDEPDPTKELALNAKSVKEEAKRLSKEIFPEYEIDILHSKMKPKEKEEVMGRFASGETHTLVATSVVEVGVNVPNATMIIIEGAERFGLAQLHQLRGRVLRSSHQAYCYAFTETKSKLSLDRLKALKTAKNGFELAEYDLAFRGSGELYGMRQSGLTDLGMEAIKNIKLVEAARTEAQELIASDPELSEYPKIKERISHIGESLHLE